MAAGGGAVVAVEQGVGTVRRLYSRWLAPLIGALALFNIFGVADNLKNLSKSIAWLMGWYRAGMDALLWPLPFHVPPTLADLLVLYLILASASVISSQRVFWPPLASAIILNKFIDKSERYHDRMSYILGREGRQKNLSNQTFVVKILLFLVLAWITGQLFGQVKSSWFRYSAFASCAGYFFIGSSTADFSASRKFMKLPIWARVAVGILVWPVRWMSIQADMINFFLKKIMLISAIALSLWGLDWFMLHYGGSLDALMASLPPPPPRRP